MIRIINFIFQRLLFINWDSSFSVHFTSQVTHPNKIIFDKKTVGKSFRKSGGCYIQGNNGIKIGKGTIFAPGVKIISSNHNKLNLDRHKKALPIIIGYNCWIGTNAVILPGVELGDFTTVGAGAVVTKSFPENYCTIVGNPARKINGRDE